MMGSITSQRDEDGQNPSKTMKEEERGDSDGGKMKYRNELSTKEDPKTKRSLRRTIVTQDLSLNVILS